MNVTSMKGILEEWGQTGGTGAGVKKSDEMIYIF